MAHGRDKYRSRENRARVREILLRDWDPIGVQEMMPEAVDEYDGYADEAYVMLMYEQATAGVIAAYLFKMAAEHMALPSGDGLAERCDRAAKLLVSLRPEIESP